MNHRQELAYNYLDISRYYFLTFAVNYDLGSPWINIKPNTEFKNEIIIARSFRYRAPSISYNFLSKFDNISFIGLKEEYEDMRKMIPNIKLVAINNALQIAQSIAGCKFFIGNQSFPFAVAEALKVKRVLEISYKTPNVIVEGENGYDFCFQAQFEQIIKDLN